MYNTIIGGNFMNKMDELRAISFIIEQAKTRKNWEFNSAKERYSNLSSNVSLTINDPNNIIALQRELGWMSQASQEMTKITGIEAQVSGIHRTISLGSTMSPDIPNRDTKLQELDQQWKKQLFDLKTQNQDFKGIMVETGYIQEKELSEKLGVELSLDSEKNTQQLELLLQEGKITPQDYAVFFLGTNYLLTDPDFIATHSQNQL